MAVAATDMDAQDYEAAVRATMPTRHALGASPVRADWDPRLAAAMQDCGAAIAEEAVAGILLEDLGIPRPEEN